nr:MAG TPA: hypothetical protein [Bacteriophage sp.]
MPILCISSNNIIYFRFLVVSSFSSYFWTITSFRDKIRYLDCPIS